MLEIELDCLLALALEIVLEKELELALVLEIGHYHITTSFSHWTCPLPPHQSVIGLALYHHITASVSHLTCPHHHISQSFDLPYTTKSLHYLIGQSLDLPHTTSVSHLTCPLPPHQSFDLPTATTSVSHLTCPIPLHHHITASVSHLPPHQSVI